MVDMKKIMMVMLSCVGLFLLVSCAGTQTTPENTQVGALETNVLPAGYMPYKTILEKNRGRAFETAKFIQTVNPDARSQEIVEGTPGLVGDIVMYNYYDSFTKQKRTDENVVNIINLKATQPKVIKLRELRCIDGK